MNIGLHACENEVETMSEICFWKAGTDMSLTFVPSFQLITPKMAVALLLEASFSPSPLISYLWNVPNQFVGMFVLKPPALSLAIYLL
tara:strand:+ start:859 stop:1119 length:261 start_codon:yes stop_codon:yes gene_type:complete